MSWPPDVERWLDLLEKAHRVCAEVRMDTANDQALHDKHVQQVSDIISVLRALAVSGAS